MLVSLLIVFREAMEAGLIIGIIAAATKGVARRSRWLAAGVLAGIGGAGLVACFAAALSNAFQGTGQELFTATILCLAVCMLSWHVLWMSRHAREMTQDMQALGRAVTQGQKDLLAMAIVVAIAVLREGSELVLFMYGIVISSGASTFQLSLGAVAGLGLAVAVSWVLYRGLVIIPLKNLFGVTNILVALLAAGMAGQAAAVLNAADLIPAWGNQLWDSSWLISDGSYPGRALHALVGYSARPCGVQLAAWAATLAVLLTAAQLIARPPARMVAAILMAACLCLPAQSARADAPLTIEFKNHCFVPSQITVPAGQKFKLYVKNDDSTADEFESTDLNREQLVTPGNTITVFLGPLDPGTYHFYGDFHQATAQGVITAK
jgi:high-affinity iron transporter